MADDRELSCDLPSVGRKKMSASFDGGRISSDGGVMVLAQAERSGPRFWDQGLEWSRVLIRHCDGGSDGEDKTEV
ncbi:MAG: hypothetical protein FJX68_03765 [Alphaproteobacteria bacterium]|nr:hypothetical protein [Alphaproteobacteria bacterium]